ncbi:hypothetical protein SZN_36354 [Streptomyces zinciresistens K42]|uniref:Uncharacterized protein n=1 Tax=Streptomyces zinciresistens K42 TaxID=700597 RepID=G2GP15_9ACTN|nr:hypothetical protein [Streptomyces zinciresistens]EGX54755.1 hypothetical protein SZN_36354 [Streptomyces zinciresistens K42]
MSLVDLIAQADERGLTAGGLACLDRCVPLLGGDDEVLRPLWANLATGGDPAVWGDLLDRARVKLGVVDDADAEDEAALLARRMLAAAPAVRSAAEARVWADACSVASLRIHRLLDPAGDDASSVGAGPGALGSVRAGAAPAEGRTAGMSPLVAAELRRQVSVLELLNGHGAGGLRRALEVSTEGRRVLRAVVSRRARGRG